MTLEEMIMARRWAREGVAVAVVARRLGRSRSTIRRWRERNVDPLAKRGRTISAKDQAIIRIRRRKVAGLVRATIRREAWHGVYGNRDPIIVLRRAFPSCLSIARELKATGYTGKVSASTVRRDLKAMGYTARVKPIGPRRHAADDAARLQFAKQYVDCDPTKFIFTDEKNCDCNDHGTRYEWNLRDQQASCSERDRYASKVMCWGAIGVGVKHLQMLDGVVTAETYIRDCLQPAVQAGIFRGRELVHDNAKPHAAMVTVAFLARKKVLAVKWPPRSPDLNPIETLWAWLQRKVDSHGPTSKAELMTFWQQQFDAIPQSAIDELVREFSLRCQACVKNGGKTLPRQWRKLLQ